MNNQMTEALILLLAGFLVVFCVLILLIIVVTIYSRIIFSVQNSEKKKKEVLKEEVSSDDPTPASTQTAYIPRTDDDEIPGEIIAVIAAAVDSIYGEKPHKLRAVKKSRSSRSAWARAGLAENTRPF